MATFGKTPPRDPLAGMPVATSDPKLLLEDILLHSATICGIPVVVSEDLHGCDFYIGRVKYRAERRDPISQARRDDAALPQTRFGDYPSD